VTGVFSLHPDFARTFWTRDYLPNILQQAATNVILATGLTFVILTGGIDLSVGSVMALCGVALGMTVKTGPPPFLALLMAFPLGIASALLAVRLAAARNLGLSALNLVAGAAGVVGTGLGALAVHKLTAGGIRLEGAILAAVMVGLGCGLLNGLVVALGRVPAFVVTLGMLTAARGLTVYATDGNSVSGLPSRLGTLGQGLPLVLIALVVVVVAAILQARTRPGRMIQAIGANEEAARLSGVNVNLHKTLAYVLSGLGAAIAAVVLTAKFQVADTGAGTGAELNAIAAVVLG
jgi:ribose/xylose/arabinose/galactoside ABC-type transport system permease subunit